MLQDIAALYSGNLALFSGTVFILGLLVGSFLNVVIYRLPVMLDRDWRAQAEAIVTDAAAQPSGARAAAAEAAPVFNLRTPRSACPACKAPITAWQNIPVVSWLLLRGRCAACQAKISVRYPIVELVTAVLSSWVACHFGFGWPAACALLMTWSLIALTGIDIDHQLLPDNITLPLMWAGLLASVLIGAAGGGVHAASLPVAPASAIIGAAAGYSSLWLVFHAFRLVTGKEGMGYGDFKLYAALGAWLGWKALPLIILLSAASGAVLGIAMILIKGRDKSQPMPFGPYLAAAGWLAMMYGDSIITGYLRVSGLSR
jgi:leader peptidase (prepilin peptidase)/N-methyltransferase